MPCDPGPYFRNKPTEIALTPATKRLWRNFTEGKARPFNDAAHSLTPPQPSNIMKFAEPYSMPSQPPKTGLILKFQRPRNARSPEWPEQMTVMTSTPARLLALLPPTP